MYFRHISSYYPMFYIVFLSTQPILTNNHIVSHIYYYLIFFQERNISMQNLNTHSFDAHSSRTNNLNTDMLDSRNSSAHNPNTYICSSFHQRLADATGPIDFPFTNDYIFRAALQKDAVILKGLICSMLRMQPDEIKSLIITNPITLGQHIDSKEFILDICLILNDETHIDLEMQVRNESDWSDRSLSYLCRNFDQLSKGEDYNASGTAIH